MGKYYSFSKCLFARKGLLFQSLCYKYLMQEIHPISYFMTMNYLFSSLVNTTSGFGKQHFQLLWLLYAAYTILVLTSLFGNSVIIHIIRTDSSMKNATSYLILNQACADLVITMANTMGVIHHSSMNKLWFRGLLGQLSCKLCLVIIFCPPIFSVSILSTIAIERFYAVARPFRSSPVSKHLKKIIFVLWVFCFVTSLPFIEKENFQIIKEFSYCSLADFLKDFTILKMFAVSLNVLLPLAVVLVLYTVVCLKLWSREVPGEGSNQNAQQAEAVKTARKVTLMMIAIVILYILCWFPLFAVGILQLSLSNFRVKENHLLFFIWLTVAYSALNPYVYLMFSQNFRIGFKRVFQNCQEIRCPNVRPLRAQHVDIDHRM